MSTSENWGVNGHTARYTITEISTAQWALWFGKDFTLSYSLLAPSLETTCWCNNDKTIHSTEEEDDDDDDNFSYTRGQE